MAFVFDAVACALQTSGRSDAQCGEYVDSRGRRGKWALSISRGGGLRLQLGIVGVGFIGVGISLPGRLKITRT
jgi:hypothetical protein